MPSFAQMGGELNSLWLLCAVTTPVRCFLHWKAASGSELGAPGGFGAPSSVPDVVSLPPTAGST